MEELFKKLQKQVNEVKEEYDIDTEIVVLYNEECNFFNISINRENYSGKTLKEALAKAIQYFNITAFRDAEEREWS